MDDDARAATKIRVGIILGNSCFLVRTPSAGSRQGWSKEESDPFKLGELGLLGHGMGLGLGFFRSQFFISWARPLKHLIWFYCAALALIFDQDFIMAHCFIYLTD